MFMQNLLIRIPLQKRDARRGTPLTRMGLLVFLAITIISITCSGNGEAKEIKVDSDYVTNWYKPRENGNPENLRGIPFLVTADEVSHIVGVFDSRTGTPLAIFPVRGTPHHPYLSRNQRWIFVTERGGNGIALIDTRHWTEKELTFPCSRRHECHSIHIGQSRDGKYAVATLQGDGGAIALIDARKGRLLRIIPGLGQRPRDAVFSRDGKKIYVSLQGENYLVVYHLKSGQVVRVKRSATSYRPFSGSALDISRDGRYLAVSNTKDNQIIVLNTRTDRIVGKIGNIPQPVNVSFLGKGDHLIATGNRKSGSISFIRFSRGKLTRIRTEKTGPGANIAYLGPDGSIWASANGSHAIHILSSKTFRLLQSIPVIFGPHWIYFSSDGRRAFVTNWGSHFVTVISVHTRKVIRSFPVGLSPNGMVLVYPEKPDQEKPFTEQEKKLAKKDFLLASRLVLPPSRTPDEKLFLKTCTMCHGVGRILRAHYRGHEWMDLVLRMKRNGASVTPEGMKEIARYLSTGAQHDLKVHTALEATMDRH
ncbi:MAG: YncE family protein [Leptospirales bacterium]